MCKPIATYETKKLHDRLCVFRADFAIAACIRAAITSISALTFQPPSTPFLVRFVRLSRSSTPRYLSVVIQGIPKILNDPPACP